MVHGKDRRQVGIGAGQRNLDGALVDGLEVGHLCRDLGNLGADGWIEMALQRIDHVVGGQRLAVVEGHS